MISARHAFALLGLGTLSCSAHSRPAPSPPSSSARTLAAPESFAKIDDRQARSAAIFLEASRVMLDPRCVNCHPDGSSPLQGRGQLHDPPVTRGDGDRGVPGLYCSSCHQDRNAELARVPGAPDWHLAPLAMAWVGRTPHALCEQLKDRQRNGDRSLEQIVSHSGHDSLVAWGWAPGADRLPAPGSQAQFGALMGAWVESGAACPPEDAR